MKFLKQLLYILSLVFIISMFIGFASASNIDTRLDTNIENNNANVNDLILVKDSCNNLNDDSNLLRTNSLSADNSSNFNKLKLNSVNKNRDNLYLISSNTNNLISNSENFATFTDLQTLIDSTEDNGVLNLDKDYTYTDSSPNNTGIIINKSITINGNNHILDGNSNSRIFNVNSSTLSLNDLKIINGNYMNYGGAIYLNNSLLNLKHCEFRNNSISKVIVNSSDGLIYQGGVIYSNSSTLNLNNTNFINNNINLDLKLDNVMKSIYLTINGGIFYLKNSSLSLINSNISSNKILINGEYDNQTSKVWIYKNGGIIYGEGSNVRETKLNIDNLNLFDNVEKFENTYNNVVSILKSNQDNDNIYFRNTNLTINNTNFYNDNVDVSNIMINSKYSILNIFNTKFNNLKAARDCNGFCIYSANDNVSLDNVNFTNITGSKGSGSAMMLFNNNYQILNSNFINCTNYGRASSIYTTLSYGNITNSNFIHCSSTEGGAIYSNKDNLTFNNSKFLDNYIHPSLTSLRNGGAIYAKDSKNLSFISCEFINNTGVYGGGIYLMNILGNINVINSIFTDNRAYYGGGIYLRDAFADLIFSNNSFHNNIANYAASLKILNYTSTLNIINSNFTNEQALIAGSLSIGGGTAYLSNNSFNNCSASNYGGAIVNHANLTMEYSNFTNNHAIYGKDIISYNSTLNLDDTNKILDLTILNNLTYSQGNFSNLTLDNGYWGYCAKLNQRTPENGTAFLVSNLNILYNWVYNIPIGEYLKILYYKYYSDLNISQLQSYTWNFTDTAFKTSSDLIIKDVINLYDSGYRIPDNGATKIIDNNQLMIFDFAALFSTDRQNYFIFKTKISDINYDLSIVKESLNKTVNQGQNVIFNIIVKNNGTVMLDNVFIKEANFDDLIFTNWQKIKGDWEYNQVNGQPFFKLLNFLGVNQTASIQVEFKTTNPGLKVNFAVTGYNDTNITNTTNNTTVKPKEVPSTIIDLYINKTVNNTNPLYYDYLTYTITVVNKNPEIIAKNVKVNEILPEGLTYIWDDSNGNYDPITGVWLIGDLTDNPATLQLKVITTKIGTITNYVNVTTSNKETNYTNNNDTVTVIVNSTIDLLSNKTVNNTSPNYLDEITWTVTISNYGICNATGVKAFEYLPEGLVYISSTVSKGFYNSTNNI